mmetsp:Transcript_3566/g.7620  ORF Transcript_3566/g.7620 Transcript_3566/m.7620 type:complete len:247 (-) Transcript_3566:700-1440(-)
MPKARIDLSPICKAPWARARGQSLGSRTSQSGQGRRTFLVGSRAPRGFRRSSFGNGSFSLRSCSASRRPTASLPCPWPSGTRFSRVFCATSNAVGSRSIRWTRSGRWLAGALLLCARCLSTRSLLRTPRRRAGGQRSSPKAAAHMASHARSKAPSPQCRTSRDSTMKTGLRLVSCPQEQCLSPAPPPIFCCLSSKSPTWRSSLCAALPLRRRAPVDSTVRRSSSSLRTCSHFSSTSRSRGGTTRGW